MTPGTQVKGANGIGGSQPPRNRIVVSAHMVMIATYSPSMNSRYGVEEYSTMKPATSSDSASGRSKGGRLVSARAEMKKITNIGNSGSQYQPKHAAGRVSCAVDDVASGSASRPEQHGDDDEADRDLVGDHLRRRAQRAEERILRVRSPAAHDDAVDAERGDREEVEDADIDVGDRPAAAERDHRPGRRAPAWQVTQRRQQEDALVGAGRDDRLLEHELEQVGEGLQQAEGADHVGAAAHLHAAQILRSASRT